MEPMPLAGSPPGTSLTWRLTDQLGTAIVGGTFAPGEVLPNEVDIGTSYQVGRSAVREAVKVLAAKGLVDSRPGRGTAVRPVGTWNLLDPDILRWLQLSSPAREVLIELLEMRMTFEPVAAGLAAERRTDAQLETIRRAFTRMQMSVCGDADPNRAKLDFHLAVLAASGNRFLAPLGALIGAGLLLNARHPEVPHGASNGSLDDHRRVLDAISARDAEDARAAMTAMLSSTDRILRGAAA